MKQKVTIVARTVEKPTDCGSKNNVFFTPDAMKNEAIVFSGKAAGICYMPDDYLSNGIQNNETAIKRAGGNTKSGHYSVFEHAHFSFIIETSKAMAMVLNSTKLYATSEKSGRYTSMNPETEIEKKYYEKWTEKLQCIIKDTYGNQYNDKEVQKLALENARYFLSVFTPTVMMFTIPFSRVILLCEWLDKMAATINDMINNRIIWYDHKSKYNYFSNIAKEAVELAEAFRSSLSMYKENPILVDHKDIGINFYEVISNYERRNFVKEILHNYHREPSFVISNVKFTTNHIRANMYCMYNTYSFACLAQEQRHRTIDYSIVNIAEEFFYIPKILQKQEDIDEWNADMKDMYDNSDVVCQATMLYVHESGCFDNFYLKCKERVCMRAQKEIMDITVDQIMQIYNMTSQSIKNNIFEELSPLNAARLLSMIDDSDHEHPMVLPRCMWKGYSCKEPCKHMTYTCTKDRLL